MDLSSEFGSIDIYVFDQLLRGRIRSDMRILDVGCGGGRNSRYLCSQGAFVVGVDRVLSAGAPPARRSRADVRSLPVRSSAFDAVLCNAVLHFLPDRAEVERAVEEMWRVLSPGGLFFARLATRIGLESRIRSLGPDRYLLPDGTERLLVDEAFFGAMEGRLRGERIDPLKTTNVENLRAMTTWVLRKR